MSVSQAYSVIFFVGLTSSVVLPTAIDFTKLKGSTIMGGPINDKGLMVGWPAGLRMHFARLDFIFTQHFF
jgi:hypothetical protein